MQHTIRRKARQLRQNETAGACIFSRSTMALTLRSEIVIRNIDEPYTNVTIQS